MLQPPDKYLAYEVGDKVLVTGHVYRTIGEIIAIKELGEGLKCWVVQSLEGEKDIMNIMHPALMQLLGDISISNGKVRTVGKPRIPRKPRW